MRGASRKAIALPVNLAVEHGQRVVNIPAAHGRALGRVWIPVELELCTREREWAWSSQRTTQREVRAESSASGRATRGDDSRVEPMRASCDSDRVPGCRDLGRSHCRTTMGLPRYRAGASGSDPGVAVREAVALRTKPRVAAICVPRRAHRVQGRFGVGRSRSGPTPGLLRLGLLAIRSDSRVASVSVPRSGDQTRGCFAVGRSCSRPTRGLLWSGPLAIPTDSRVASTWVTAMPTIPRVAGQCSGRTPDQSQGCRRLQAARFWLFANTLGVRWSRFEQLFGSKPREGWVTPTPFRLVQPERSASNSDWTKRFYADRPPGWCGACPTARPSRSPCCW